MSTATKAVNIGNSIIDTVQGIADNPLIGLIGLVFPQANAVIDVIRRYGPTIDAAQPIIAEAVEAGEPVFDKVIEQLPQFGKVVSKITALLPAAGNVDAEKVVENVARALGSFHKMTFEEEMRWMKMTAGEDPSEENSQKGSG